MRRRPAYASLLCILLSIPLHAATPTTRLVSYRCQVKKMDAHRAEVSAVMVTSNAPGKPLVFMIGRWDGDQIEDIAVSTEGRLDREVKIEPLAAAIRVVVQAPSESSVQVAYSVKREDGELTRISLAVPLASPALGQTPVEITLALPLGDIHYGEQFPRLEWQSDDRASTTMGSVPSLMILHSKARGTISRMDDWLASRVADAGMCLLLLAGSAGWWLNYRSGKETSTVKGRT